MEGRTRSDPVALALHFATLLVLVWIGVSLSRPPSASMLAASTVDTSALDATLARLDRLLGRVGPASSGLVMRPAGPTATGAMQAAEAGGARLEQIEASRAETRTAMPAALPAARQMDLRPLVEAPPPVAVIRSFCDGLADRNNTFVATNASVLLMTPAQVLGKLGRPKRIGANEAGTIVWEYSGKDSNGNERTFSLYFRDGYCLGM